MSLALLGWNVALVSGLMTALWVVSVRLRDASIVDPWWSISFLLVTVHTALRTGVTRRRRCCGSWWERGRCACGSICCFAVVASQKIPAMRASAGATAEVVLRCEHEGSSPPI